MSGWLLVGAAFALDTSETGDTSDTGVPADTGVPEPATPGAADWGVGRRHLARWVKQYGMDGDEEPFAVVAAPEGTFVAGTTTSSWFRPFLDPCLDEEHAVARDCGDAVLFDTRTGLGVQTGDLASDEVRAMVVADGLVTFAGRSRDPLGLQRQGGYVTRYTADLLVEVWDTRMPKSEFLGVAMWGGASFPVGGTLFEWEVGEPKVGSEDALTMKVSDLGVIELVQQIGSTEFDELHDVQADATGLYISGITTGVLGAQNLGDEDGILLVWSQTLDLADEVCRVQLGTTRRDGAEGVAVYGDYLYVGGNTEGVMNGELPDGATCYHTDANRLPDAYIAKYDKQCNHLWTREFGGFLGDAVEGITVDDQYVYATGYANAGTDHEDEPRAPTTDAFLRVYTHDGALAGEVIFDSSPSPDDQRVDLARGIFVDEAFVYVAGTTAGDMGTRANAGGTDMFLAKVPIAEAVADVTYEGDGCD